MGVVLGGRLSRPNDFLGVLVGSTSTSNYAGWRSEAFDAAVEQATSATDAATASGAYAEAQRVLRDEVPVVPVSYGVDWRLTRAGLLGAAPNGMGITRFAGLAPADAG